MKKESITLNGLFLWYRHTGSSLAFARQLEPTKGLVDEKDPICAPIYVGFEGSDGEDLVGVLQERERLKKRVLELEVRNQNELWDFTDRLEKRICDLEDQGKKWWKFWG